MRSATMCCSPAGAASRTRCSPRDCATRCASRWSASTRMEISVAMCSSATEISPRSQRSPMRHSAGAMISSSIRAVSSPVSIASRIAISAAASSAERSASA
jgi:hypothetical protein